MAATNNPKKISKTFKYMTNPYEEEFGSTLTPPPLKLLPTQEYINAIDYYIMLGPKPTRYGYDASRDAFIIDKKENLEVSPKVVVSPLCFACKHPVCEACGECEEKDCVLIGRFITTKGGMLDVGLVQARTQKAKGFIQLKNKFGLNMPTPYSIIMEDDDIQYAKEIDAYIRPCPIRPRHGFVESNRMISTQENIRTVWEACKAADSEGELIICRAINAKYNAIITPSMLAVGPGNAGATGGKDSVSIPLMGVLPPEIQDTTKLLSVGVDINVHDPYLELVIDNDDLWYYTQLRAGAKVPKAPDYVPELMRVERTLEASGDLIEWEKQVGTITQGTVVYHIGGTLISHYGVHCLTNHIPIFTTRIPTIGDVLEPIGEKVQHEPQQMIRGLALGVMVPMDQSNSTKFRAAELLPLMMTVLHNSPAMGNGWGVWVGFAASIMIRCGMAASHGEARHAKPEIKRKFTRNAIYSAAFQDFFGSRDTLGQAQSSFLYYRWGESAFGGKKWASCTESIILLDKAARDLMRSPTEAHRVGVVNALNRAVNEAHNGGWWLNKFVTEDKFNQASKQNLRALERVAEVLVPINTFFNAIPAEAWKSVAFKWANAGEIDIPIPGVIKTIDEDGDIDDKGNEPPQPFMADYDKSVGTDPNCCADCWDMYHYKLKKKLGNEASPSSSPFKVMTVPSDPTPTYTGKAKKIPFGSSMTITKAHVRLEWTGSHYNAHIQCKDGNYYVSFDTNIDKETSAIIFTKLTDKISFEGSYSSSSGGYLDMSIAINGSSWALTEPITGIIFALDFKGNIYVCLGGGKEVGQTETEKEALVSE